MKLDFIKGSRSKWLAAIIVGIAAVFVLRLFYIQIIRHDYYQNLADSEQIKRLDVPATRGQIYALSGNTPVPLVMNQTVYTLFADPATVNDVDGIIKEINSVVGSAAQPNLKALLTKKGSRYAILAKNITSDQAEAIKKKDFAGIGFQQGTQRVYPEGSLAAQVLGFVNADGKGQYGVEQALNTQLTGKDGVLQSVTDVSDVPLTIGSKNIKKPAVNGTNEVLTIDRNIQAEAEQALADGVKKSNAPEGSVLVMDPNNGRILAMANLPSYDPANYGDATSAADFNNATIDSPYEPGSDVKTITMAVGVDTGAVTPDSTYNNTGVINVDGTNIHNAEGDKEFGTISLQTAMNYSLNTGFVTVAERLGKTPNTIDAQARNTMYDYFYNKFKLGQLTGIQLAGELPGTIIPPTTTQGNAVRYSNMAFGQGLDLTMVQVATAFSSFVNGGHLYKPTIIAGSIDDNGIYKQAATGTYVQDVKASTAATIRSMTHIARTTLFPHADTPGYYMGGKTGTSQQVVNGQYSDTDTTATYLGYGGTQASTKYVIMVRVTGPGFRGSGALDAMPIFTTISNWLTNYLNIPPQD